MPSAAPTLRGRHQGQALTVPATIGTGIRPSGTPHQGDPESVWGDIHPLRPIEQHRQPPPGEAASVATAITGSSQRICSPGSCKAEQDA